MIVLVLLVVALGAWAGWVEPRQLKFRRISIELKDLQAPFRAVVVADIQPNAYHWSTQRLKTTFAAIQQQEDPDFVFWLGDYFNAPTDKMKEFLDQNRRLKIWVESHLPRMRDIAEAMAELKGRIGTVAVLGNHDWAWSGARTQRRLEEFGIRVLKDDVALFKDPATEQILSIVGYEDISSGRHPNFAAVHQKLDPSTAQIALSHSPDAFPLASEGPMFMISGHTHGGQVRIPFLGPLLLPIKYKQFDRGLFHVDGRCLFVSSGLGTSLPPFRFLCPPEVIVLDFLPVGENQK